MKWLEPRDDGSFAEPTDNAGTSRTAASWNWLASLCVDEEQL